jgi:hypothetical protein
MEKTVLSIMVETPVVGDDCYSCEGIVYRDGKNRTWFDGRCPIGNENYLGRWKLYRGVVEVVSERHSKAIVTEHRTISDGRLREIVEGMHTDFGPTRFYVRE